MSLVSTSQPLFSILFGVWHFSRDTGKLLPVWGKEARTVTVLELSHRHHEGWGLNFLSPQKRGLDWGRGGKDHVDEGFGLFFVTPDT